MKRAIIVLVILGAMGAGGWAYYVRRNTVEVTVNTSPVSRGDIIESVGSTGTLQAVTTVTVGTQVSGTIQWLGADFNAIVKKDQVIARIDPALLQAQLDSSKANLTQAQANATKAQSDLERMNVGLRDAQQRFNRTKELAGKSLAPLSDLDAAQIAVDTAQANVKSQQSTIIQVQAAVKQSEAAVNQNQVNLDHTIITSPIDGIVTQRSVDVGQTVNANQQAPTIFILAADLTKMQVSANIDESDVGKIRPGQKVTFRVDAYPTDNFEGTVTQVRLQPVVVSNVTTYGTIIAVSNPDLKLKPGMTSNLKVEVHHQNNVVRVANAALRFRPTVDIFAALNQPVPPEAAAIVLGRGGRGGGGGGRNGGGGNGGGGNGGGNFGGRNGGGGGAGAQGAPAAGAPAAGTAAPVARGGNAAATTGQGNARPAAPAAAGADQTASADQGQGRRNRGGGQGAGNAGDGGGNGFGGGGFGGGGRGQGGQGGGRGQGGGFGGGGGRGGGQALMDRFNAMTADEQKQFIDRMKGRGADVTAYQAAAKKGGGTPVLAPKYGEASAESIDALFPPLVSPNTAGRAWLYADKQLKLVNLRLGITDGTNTEVLSADALQLGQEVVTSVSGVGPGRPGFGGNNNNAGNPLLGNQNRGGGPGGPGGPGGFGGPPPGGGR